MMMLQVLQIQADTGTEIVTVVAPSIVVDSLTLCLMDPGAIFRVRESLIEM